VAPYGTANAASVPVSGLRPCREDRCAQPAELRRHQTDEKPGPFGINEELRRCGRLARHTSAGLGAGRSRRLCRTKAEGGRSSGWSAWRCRGPVGRGLGRGGGVADADGRV